MREVIMWWEGGWEWARGGDGRLPHTHVCVYNNACMHICIYRGIEGIGVGTVGVGLSVVTVREIRHHRREREDRYTRGFTKSYEQLRTRDRCKRMVGHADDDDVLPPFRELTLDGPTDYADYIVLRITIPSPLYYFTSYA